MIEFTPYPKTARLFKDGLGMVVTEKIDGTNAAVVITAGTDITRVNHERLSWQYSRETTHLGEPSTVSAQSRNRMIAPAAETGDKGSDNYGFAAWVWDNAEALVNTLGPASTSASGGASVSPVATVRPRSGSACATRAAGGT